MLTYQPKVLSSLDSQALQRWLNDPACRLFKRCLRRRIARLQIELAHEALKGRVENRSVELAEASVEIARAADLLDTVEKFERGKIDELDLGEPVIIDV
jgi:hypothetical protein